MEKGQRDKWRVGFREEGQKGKWRVGGREGGREGGRDIQTGREECLHQMSRDTHHAAATV